VLLRDKVLLHREDIPLGSLPNADAIASPSNICKVTRLESLNLSRALLPDKDRKIMRLKSTTDRS
jgi:hypothetical protein